MADRQTSVYSSYSMFNVFDYQGLGSVIIDSEYTPEMREDLQKIVENALRHFCVYNNILWLTCELLGHYLENLQNFLCDLFKDLNLTICENLKTYYSLGKKPPPAGLPSYVYRWLDEIPINIEDKIRRQLARFPILKFLGDAFDGFFKEIRETLYLAGAIRRYDCYQDVTVGCYLKQIAWLDANVKIWKRKMAKKSFLTIMN